MTVDQETRVEKKTDESPIVGSVVVHTNEVCFCAFRADSGDVVRTYRVPVKNVFTVRSGHAEQDPKAILNAVRVCVENTVTAGKVLGANVVAVGLANHRATVVAWDKNTGAPLCNAILWSDSRSASVMNEYLGSGNKYRFQKLCGLPFSPYFSAFKIAWLLRNVVTVINAYKEGRCYFGTVDSWLLWNLTGGVKGGVFATDSSNASSTFLMNINTLKWDKSLLKFFGISPNCLPEIKTSCEVYGKFADGALAGVPISGVIGNRQAAIVGHRCFHGDVTKVTLDASGSVFTVTGDSRVFSRNGLLTTVAYQMDQTTVFALEGPIASAGKSIEWTKSCLNVEEPLCPPDSSKTKKLPRFGKVYFVPALNGLYAPHWRPNARCCFVGLSKYTVKEDILNSAMESVAFQTQDIVESMNTDLKTTIKNIRVDGYLSSNKMIMQTLADLTNANVEVSGFKDMAALGTAMVAGHACKINVWKTLSTPDEDVIVYSPKIDEDERATRIFDWKRAVRRCYEWVDLKKAFNYFYLTAPLVGGALLMTGLFLLKK